MVWRSYVTYLLKLESSVVQWLGAFQFCTSLSGTCEVFILTETTILFLWMGDKLDDDGV